MGATHGGALLAAALLLVTPHATAAAATAGPSDGVPPTASAAWLTGLLGPGAVVVDPALEVDDVDATLDLLLGLVASGGAGDTVSAVADALVADLDRHTGADLGATFVSATAKLTLGLAAAGRDPRDLDGTDLVDLLADRVGTDGRARDRSDLGDLSTPASQALAVLALDRAGADPALVLSAADALAVAACADGGVPAEFAAEPCVADPVTTALAAAALAAAADAAGTDAALAAARDAAIAALPDAAAAGTADPWAAGLTVTALRASGRDAEADALAAGLAQRVDGCDGGATAAVVDAADPLRATVGVLLATSGATLTELTRGEGAGAIPLDCSPEPDGAAAASDDGAASTPSPDAAAPDATTGDDGGAGGPVAVVVATAVLAIAVLAGVPVLRRTRRRDEADRAAARGA